MSIERSDYVQIKDKIPFPLAPEKSELDNWLLRINPDLLPPLSILNGMREEMVRTPQWRRFQHLPVDLRTIRLGLSPFTEIAAPFIHFFLGDKVKLPKRNFVARPDPKATVVGTSLHEGLSLVGLNKHRKEDMEEVSNSFPSSTDELALPFFEALKKGKGAFDEAWENLHKDSRLVDRSKYLLSEEFAELPLSMEKQEEVGIRSSPEVYEAGLKLERSLMEHETGDKGYLELMSINNFEELSEEHKTRIQIATRYDEVVIRRVGKDIVIDFFDLKTGKRKKELESPFQALLVKFLAGHFVDHFIRRGQIENRGEAFVTSRIKNIVPKTESQTLTYGYFDQDTGELLEVPVYLNYDNDGGKLFLEWLSFYSTACVVFKKEVTDFIKYGRLPAVERFTDFQEELSDDYQITVTEADRRSLEEISTKLNNIERKKIKLNEFYETGELCDDCGGRIAKQFSLNHIRKLTTELAFEEICSSCGRHDKGVKTVFNQNIIWT